MSGDKEEQDKIEAENLARDEKIFNVAAEIFDSHQAALTPTLAERTTWFGISRTPSDGHAYHATEG